MPSAVPLCIPCRADLWCRKRTSLSTMLDPDLYDRYKTEDDRIDEEWIVQSNPPCAFKAEFKEGCDALFELLRVDAGLHATKGWLNFTPPAHATAGVRPHVDKGSDPGIFLEKMKIVVRTAERELKATT